MYRMGIGSAFTVCLMHCSFDFFSVFG